MKRDETPTLRAFLRKRWYYLVLLAAEFIARMVAEGSAPKEIPRLALNLMLIVSVLGTLYLLLRSVLQSFGTPTAYTEVRHHKQEVSLVTGPEVDRVRQVLHDYVVKGSREDAYRDLIQSIARANGVEPADVDPLLRSLPPSVGAGKAVHRPGLLAAGSLALGLAVASAVMSFIPGPMLRAATVALGAGLLLAPYAHRALRSPGDPAPVAIFLVPTLLGAGILTFLLLPAGLPAALLPALLAAPILAMLVDVLRRGRSPVPALRNVEVLARTERFARGLRTTAILLAGSLLAWEALATALGGIADIPGPSGRIWTGFLFAAVLLAAAWAALGPGQREPREDWAGLHKEDTRRRRAHHLTILGRVEQRLAV